MQAVRTSGFDGDTPEARVRATLEAYFDAFHSSDSERYADLWSYPASVWSHGEWWQIPDRETCVETNRAYEQEARAQGMAGGRILRLDVRFLGRTSALATGLFSRLAPDGSTLATVEASYLLVEKDEQWKVVVCVLKD
ncbi:MAG TPA: nuclear transport factor 2 family protein [Steroidobacteraceae bacterium]|nr:nuclear transport factor 2 family protein [Steroidobacteraceae bacterium]